MADAYLQVDSGDLKSLREALCVAEGHLLRSDQYSGQARHLSDLIKQVDVHRPLGPDCKHGTRHTATCEVLRNGVLIFAGQDYSARSHTSNAEILTTTMTAEEIADAKDD